MMTERPVLAAPMVEHALWYARFGLKVIPAHAKAPWMTDWPTLATRDEAQIILWYSQWPDENIAALMGEPYVALDIDARAGGLDALAELEASYQTLPDTVTSLSGSGGGSCHKLFLPPPGVIVPNMTGWRPGIDVIVKHKCIILPPSIHPSGHRYTWECDFGPEDIAVATLPDWLVALLCDGSASGRHGPAPITDPTAPIPTGHREATLVRLGGALRRAGASELGILAALEVENLRCQEPLAAQDLVRIARSMMRYPSAPQLLVANTAPPGWYSPAPNGAQANGVHLPGVPSTWRQELFVKKNGETYANEFNINTILQSSDHWQKPENALWYDVLTGRHMIDQRQIDRPMLHAIARWFGGAERMQLTSLKLLEDCLHARCEEHQRDRVKLWLESLPPWHGPSHLETWLIETAHVEDDPIGYNRHLSRRLILSMVARGLRPGCQYREVVVLEGPENIGKSHIVETLASKEFCIVLSMNLEAKEAHMMLQRAWLAELADLDSMNRTEETRLKAFITMEEDTYVPKYRNESISVPRRAIFVATTNDRAYLKSLSGNTRFLPLWVPGPVDLEALHGMREQLFAEAMQVYHASGEGWWHMPDAIQVEAARRRETRRIKNPYEVPLGHWLGDRTETTWPEIAEHFLYLKTPEDWKDRSLQMQIGSALRAIGFETCDEWRADLNNGKGGKWHGWTRHPDTTEESWNF